jgi:preprotein translocase subunit SecY
MRCPICKREVGPNQVICFCGNRLEAGKIPPDEYASEIDEEEPIRVSPVIEGAIDRGKNTCFNSLLITAILVGLYWLGHSITMPGINSAYFSALGNPGVGRSKLSIFALGYNPFIIGFTFIEILSLIVPVGRQMRNEGSAGRAMLNQIALGTSIVICAIQSLMTAFMLKHIGLRLVTNPDWLFHLLTCATLTAGSISVFYIAQIISRKGIANGFCILIAVDILTEAFRQLRFSPSNLPEATLKCLLAAAVMLLTLFTYYQRNAATTVMTVEPGESVKLDIPVFPQGTMPISWAFSIISLSALVHQSNSRPFGFWPFLLATTILIVLFSAIGLVIFSSGKRIIHNLPIGVRLDDSTQRLLRIQTIKSTAVLAGGSAAMLILEKLFEPDIGFNFSSLIILFAIALDLIDQWKFSCKHNASAELIELDNPHLASYLKNLLKSSGIDTVIQTYHYRRLLFFFGPLTKMRMLVPAEEIERARELIDLKNIRIV